VSPGSHVSGVRATEVSTTTRSKGLEKDQGGEVTAAALEQNSPTISRLAEHGGTHTPPVDIHAGESSQTFALRLGEARIYLGVRPHSRAGCVANAARFHDRGSAEVKRSQLGSNGFPWRVVRVDPEGVEIPDSGI
jgi:hypothetical protein